MVSKGLGRKLVLHTATSHATAHVLFVLLDYVYLLLVHQLDAHTHKYIHTYIHTYIHNLHTGNRITGQGTRAAH